MKGKVALVVAALVLLAAATPPDHKQQALKRHHRQVELAWCAKEWRKYSKRIEGYKVLHVRNPEGQARSDLLAEAIFTGHDCPQN